MELDKPLNASDLFGVVVRAIGLGLLVYGIFLLTRYLCHILVLYFGQGGIWLGVDGFIEGLLNPLISICIGSSLLRHAERIVTIIYGKK